MTVMNEFPLSTFSLTAQQVLGYVTVYCTVGACTYGFDIVSSEMDSLQHFLSFEYKCSLFLVEMHCIIFQNKFEVRRNWSFYFNVKFGLLKSTNEKPTCN